MLIILLILIVFIRVTESVCEKCTPQPPLIYYQFINDNTTEVFWDDSGHLPREDLECTEGDCYYYSNNGSKWFFVDDESRAEYLNSEKLFSLVNESYSIHTSITWNDYYLPFPSLISPPYYKEAVNVKVGKWKISGLIKRIFFTVAWEIRIMHEDEVEPIAYTIPSQFTGLMHTYVQIDGLTVDIECSKSAVNSSSPGTCNLYIDGIQKFKTEKYYAASSTLEESDIVIESPTHHFRGAVAYLGVMDRTSEPAEREMWRNWAIPKFPDKRTPEKFVPHFCHGIGCNETFVCSGHGYCIEEDDCCCEDGWIGNMCEVPQSSELIALIGCDPSLGLKGQQACLYMYAWSQTVIWFILWLVFMILFGLCCIVTSIFLYREYIKLKKEMVTSTDAGFGEYNPAMEELY